VAKKISEEEVRQWVTMRQAGASIKAIADKFNRHAPQIHKKLKEAGVVTPKKEKAVKVAKAAKTGGSTRQTKKAPKNSGATAAKAPENKVEEAADKPKNLQDLMNQGGGK